MRYNELLAALQNLKPNEEIDHIYIGKLLNYDSKSMYSKKVQNYNFKNNELQTIENKLNIILPQNDCVALPVRGDVSASCGFGVTICSEGQTGMYTIGRKLAKDLGISISESEIIFAKGDSMSPTIEGGDGILVDTSKKEVYDGAIYCVRIEGQLYAKRLQKIPPKKVLVVSDNQKYKSFEVDFSKNLDFDFEVIGEVKWAGRVFL